MAMAPTFEKLSVKIQEMLEEFSKGEGPLKKIGDLFGTLFEEATIEIIKDMPAKIGNFVTKLEDLAEYLKPIPGYVEEVIFWGKILGVVLAMALAGIAIALLPITLGFKAIAAIITGVGLAVSYLLGLFKQKNSPSFLDLFTGGVLAKGLKTVKDAMQLIIGPIKKVASVFKSLGETIANTFNFDNIKETVRGFVDWLPGTWGESVDGIKTEMEIASPSKKMEREIINPTFVEPMQSVSAQMPQLVEEVYKEVSFKGPATEMRTSLEREKMNQAMAPTNIQNNVTAGANTTTVVEKNTSKCNNSDQYWWRRDRYYSGGYCRRKNRQY